MKITVKITRIALGIITLSYMISFLLAEYFDISVPFDVSKTEFHLLVVGWFFIVYGRWKVE